MIVAGQVRDGLLDADTEVKIRMKRGLSL